MEYKPTIGLEVHAELATTSKMFCGCQNKPHESEPNTNVCPVCMAHPGTLPVANKEAVEMVLRFGQAVGATKASYSEFDRKNYFYPDIPKAYQISQYQFPFLSGGSLLGVDLTRVHLEEDTARSSHEHVDGSLVDFNRAGVPLMELVTEPVLHSAKEAGDFARELKLLLQTLQISEANLERGEMRIEVNISLSATDELGTKVEVKNINSFKAAEAAIAYEIVRQTELLETNGEIFQETRGWNENTGSTFAQRSKETAKDYRYFPDPDLPKMQLDEFSEFTSESLSEKIPVLPEKKRELYLNHNVKSEIIETIISDKKLDLFFSKVFAAFSEDQKEVLSALAANYISVDIAGILIAEPEYAMDSIDIEVFKDLMLLVNDGSLGSRGAKDLLPELPELKGDLHEIVKTRGLVQLSDASAVMPIVEQIIAENPDQVLELKGGKETVIKYLVGQGMKLSKGSANPQLLEELLISEITK